MHPAPPPTILLLASAPATEVATAAERIAQALRLDGTHPDPTGEFHLGNAQAGRLYYDVLDRDGSQHEITIDCTSAEALAWLLERLAPGRGVAQLAQRRRATQALRDPAEAFLDAWLPTAPSAFTIGDVLIAQHRLGWTDCSRHATAKSLRARGYTQKIELVFSTTGAHHRRVFSKAPTPEHDTCPC